MSWCPPKTAYPIRPHNWGSAWDEMESRRTFNLVNSQGKYILIDWGRMGNYLRRRCKKNGKVTRKTLQGLSDAIGTALLLQMPDPRFMQATVWDAKVTAPSLQKEREKIQKFLDTSTGSHFTILD
jgi:hypothetical protein